MQDLRYAWAEVAGFALDTDFLSQDALDVAVRERTSVYPWRGQFSPGLVELLLGIQTGEETHAGETVVLDPFVGSGTTLFECIRQGLACWGAEINPAALQLAGMARFANLELPRRREIAELAEMLLLRHLPAYLPPTLLSAPIVGAVQVPLEEAVATVMDEASADEYLYNFLAVCLMLAFGDGRMLSEGALRSSFERNRAVIETLPYRPQMCTALLADARSIPLPDASVSLIITSPPYINVFNYHQNFRPVMEMMGWRMLEVAPSEIGANRKHRGNRFMTVLQFCIDMAQCVLELRRLLAKNAKAIFVIGRESKVRGVPFANGHLLALTATATGALALERWQERKFVNRFGSKIFEDILTFVPLQGAVEDSVSLGREAGVLALTDALERASVDIQGDIKDALDAAESIQPSPLLSLAAQPNAFAVR